MKIIAINPPNKIINGNKTRTHDNQVNPLLHNQFNNHTHIALPITEPNILNNGTPLKIVPTIEKIAKIAYSRAGVQSDKKSIIYNIIILNIMLNAKCEMRNILVTLKLRTVLLEYATLRHDAFHLIGNNCGVLVRARSHPDFNDAKVFLG
jgi:hypothetical protein